MSHPHDDFLDPFVRALLKDRIQSRNQGLPAFQRKTLLTDVAGVQKVFKLFGLNDFSQDSQLFIVRKGGLVFIGLDTGLNPTPFFGRLNMKVLDTNAPAIGSFQSFENFPNRHSNPAKIISGKMDFRKSAGSNPSRSKLSLGLSVRSSCRGSKVPGCARYREKHKLPHINERASRYLRHFDSKKKVVPLPLVREVQHLGRGESLRRNIATQAQGRTENPTT